MQYLTLVHSDDIFQEAFEEEDTDRIIRRWEIKKNFFFCMYIHLVFYTTADLLSRFLPRV